MFSRFLCTTFDYALTVYYLMKVPKEKEYGALSGGEEED